MTAFRVGSASDVGQIRTLNQDAKLVAEGATLFAVADGMGGHQGGEVASAIAVETLEATALEPTTSSVVEAVKEANRRIFARGADAPELRGMGTTLVAISLVRTGDAENSEEIAWVNVGDSRVYLLRDGEMRQLSRDHSLVEDLRRGGQLSDEEAASYPQRNILTRALGIDTDVQVDTGSVLPFRDDRFLLCSDGLFNEVDDPAIIEVLTGIDDPDAAADELVRRANAGGGRDNITCVVVVVADDGGRAERAAAAGAAGVASASTDGAGEPEGGAATGDPDPASAVSGEPDQTQELPTVAVDDEPPPGPDSGAVSPHGWQVPPPAPDPPPADADPPPAEADPTLPDAEVAVAQAGAAVPADGPAPAPGAAPPGAPESGEPILVTASPAAAGGSVDADPPTDTEPPDEDLPFGRDTNDLYSDMSRARGRHWILTVLAVLIVLGGLAAAAYFGGAWYASRGYYVAASGDEVQIYKGRPEGFAIFDPELEEETGVNLDDASARERGDIRRRREFDSLGDAQSFVNAIAQRAAQSERRGGSTTTTTTTTTTTAPTTTTGASTTSSTTDDTGGDSGGGIETDPTPSTG